VAELDTEELDQVCRTEGSPIRRIWSAPLQFAGLPFTPMAIFRDGELLVNLDQQTVTKDGKPVGLLFWEYGVLAALVSRRGEVISSHEFVRGRLGNDRKSNDQESHVRRLETPVQVGLGWARVGRFSDRRSQLGGLPLPASYWLTAYELLGVPVRRIGGYP